MSLILIHGKGGGRGGGGGGSPYRMANPATPLAWSSVTSTPGSVLAGWSGGGGGGGGGGMAGYRRKARW